MESSINQGPPSDTTKHFNTSQLMRIIGLPNLYAGVSRDVSEDTLLGLLPSAIKNRIPLLFLEQAVTICKDSESIKNLHQTYLKKSQLALDLIEKISKILSRNRTDYVIFKTFKPFPFATVDVDIFFFASKDLMRAYHALRVQDHELAGYGAHSTTLYSPKHGMNIDLQQEISVSRMIYVDKQLLRRYVTEIDLNGSQVRVLQPPAALAMVIAHSFYKEQMFTLSDYYTTIIQMSRMSKKQRKILVNLAEELNVGLSLKLALNVTRALTSVIFQINIPVITETTRWIHTNEVEEKSMRIALSYFAKNAKLPHKYHPLSVALAFIVKSLKDPIMRVSMAQQLMEMVTNTSKFWESMLLHIERDTY